LYYGVPAWLQALIEKGALGQKTRCGIFRKDGRTIKVLDLAARDYRESAGEIDATVLAILKNRDPAEKFAQLRASEQPQAQFLWSIFRDIFHYAAFHLADIADNARDLDFAMRWGFGWAQGPFESWQAAGWRAIAEAVQADIDAGLAMSPVATAGMGVRRGRGRRRAYAAGLVLGARRRLSAALDAAGLSAPALPRAGARRKSRQRRNGLGE
jgi:3-hydroxyacyl-CoA dehydrogenase